MIIEVSFISLTYAIKVIEVIRCLKHVIRLIENRMEINEKKLLIILLNELCFTSSVLSHPVRYSKRH
jgi:hypothetical protein